MPYYVYILQSESTGRFYCGQTNDLERRFQEQMIHSIVHQKPQSVSQALGE
jgi:predicted GIY-YIG superfamily endonuclease